ncbi:protein distal antenna-like [Coccinella septempunctata]|uniref:protein distal antenna-like n=1 Tax=Coccinella septempunctata TaxID=41139 RepID=UPI001D066CDC|nr:protein distal antenna-like [Coccinella septempunctata]
MASRANKRPSRAKQPWEKMTAIQRVINGESKAAVARALDVPESTLRGWCKNQEKIIASAEAAKAGAGSPVSVTSTEVSEGREKRIKLDDSVPQNLSVRAPPVAPEAASDIPSAIDLSRTSPQATSSRTDNGMMMNAQDISQYYQAARFSQMFQQAIQAQGMSFLTGNNGGSLLTTAPRQPANGVPNLPNDRLPPEESVRQWLNASNPSQVSPNSSSATLSTPLNGQQTTSPMAGITPEQNNLYLEWYKAVISRVGMAAAAPFNMPMSAANIPILYNQLMQNNNNERTSVSYPTTPRQSASTSTAAVSTQPREEPAVPSTSSNDQIQTPGCSQSTQQISSTVRQCPSKSASPMISPVSSRQSASPSTSGNSTVPSRRNDLVSPVTSSTSSTLDLSQDAESSKTRSRPVASRRKTKNSVSLETLVSNLKEDVDDSNQSDSNMDIKDCIEVAKTLLAGLKRNSAHPGITASQLKQIQTLITTISTAEESFAKRRSE